VTIRFATGLVGLLVNADLSPVMMSNNSKDCGLEAIGTRKKFELAAASILLAGNSLLLLIFSWCACYLYVEKCLNIALPGFATRKPGGTGPPDN
jgi:hypothetical protein